MSTKRKWSVLSIKGKQILISRLDKEEKGTNLVLEFGISKQQISDIRKNKDKILKFTKNIETSKGLKQKSLKLANDERLDQAGLLHLVYSAEVDWNIHFRPASSGESETFLHAVEWRVSWSRKLQSINWMVRQIQKSTWHKEPQYSRWETFSSRRNCFLQKLS